MHLRKARGRMNANTLVELQAMGRGSGLFIDENESAAAQPISAATFIFTRNIVETFGSNDSTAVYYARDSALAPLSAATSVISSATLLTATAPVYFATNNWIYSFGKQAGGRYSDFTDTLHNFSEKLVYQDPDTFKYTIGRNTRSAIASGTGEPIGWNPFGLHALAPVRTLRVTEDYPTISQALTHASRGDNVVVQSGTYTESLVIPSGVWLKSASGPLKTIILNATRTSNIPTVGVRAYGVNNRTAVSGFSVGGFTTGVETDTNSGFLISDIIAFASDTLYGIKVTTGPRVRGRPYQPWIAENTLYQTTEGIRIETIAPTVRERDPIFCRLNLPMPGLSARIDLPWIHHNAVIQTKRGIVLAQAPPSTNAFQRLPIARNDLYFDPEQGGVDWVNLPQLTHYRFNQHQEPAFIEETVIPGLNSILRSLHQKDRRRIGALDSRYGNRVPGDLNLDGLFDDEDVLMLDALIQFVLAANYLPPSLQSIAALNEQTDWNRDGMLTQEDVRLAAQVFVGAIQPEDTLLGADWLRAAQEGGNE